MADGINPATVRAAVKTILETVSGVGKVDRPGGLPTWVRESHRRPQQAYFEVDWTSALEEQYAAGEHIDEFLLIKIEGWMPFSYGSNSAATWDPLMQSVKDALRTKRTLNGVVDDSEPPQLRQNNYSLVADGEKEVHCHHCLIELRTRHDFSYELT